MDASSESPETPPPPDGPKRQGRRLSDKILIAFHSACDQADFEVAEQLLTVVEKMIQRRRYDDERERRTEQSLVAAHERLWTARRGDRA